MENGDGPIVWPKKAKKPKKSLAKVFEMASGEVLIEIGEHILEHQDYGLVRKSPVSYYSSKFVCYFCADKVWVDIDEHLLRNQLNTGEFRVHQALSHITQLLGNRPCPKRLPGVRARLEK